MKFLRKFLFFLKRRFRNIHKHVLFCVLSVFSFSFSLYWTLTERIPTQKESPMIEYEVSKSKIFDDLEEQLHMLIVSEYLTGCNIPILEPFVSDMVDYNESKVKCDTEDWVECYLSQCTVKPTILSTLHECFCEYEDVIYSSDDRYGFGSSTKIPCVKPYVLSISDHVRISCKGEFVENENRLWKYWSGIKTGLRPVTKVTHTNYTTTSTSNVMMIIFKSVSRNQFVRRMPKSYKYLVEKLNATVLNKYNIVGHATAGAMIPILTGRMELELPGTKIVQNGVHNIPKESFIFHHLNKRGYRTAYFEDSLFGFNNFAEQPADHYLKSFFQELNKKTRNKPSLCAGEVPEHQLLLNLTEQFFTLPGRKFSVTFSTGLSNNNISMISAADDDLEEFLRRFHKWGNNTLLFVMSDHGSRFPNSIRNTYKAKIEGRLPFVSIVLPESFKNETLEIQVNLAANSEVLTTPFDIQATLADFLNLEEFRNYYQIPGSYLDRGLSLFNPIPSTRSCAVAGIMPHWCACANLHNISTDDPMYNRIGKELAVYIDDITSYTWTNRLLCAKRELASIEWITKQKYYKSLLNFIELDSMPIDRYFGWYSKQNYQMPKNEFYQARIKMSPDDAIFEAKLIRRHIADDYIVISEANLSRIDTGYLNESKCIENTEPRLIKYCFCRSNPTKHKPIQKLTSPYRPFKIYEY